MSEEAPVTMQELVGKHVLIGITRLDHTGQLIRQEQHHGRIISVGKTIHIQLSSGRDFQLPPDTRSFRRAARGEYRLRSTGEVVVDPDFTTSWTINSPPPDFKPSKRAHPDATQ